MWKPVWVHCQLLAIFCHHKRLYVTNIVTVWGVPVLHSRIWLSCSTAWLAQQYCLLLVMLQGYDNSTAKQHCSHAGQLCNTIELTCSIDLILAICSWLNSCSSMTPVCKSKQTTLEHVTAEMRHHANLQFALNYNCSGRWQHRAQKQSNCWITTAISDSAVNVLEYFLNSGSKLLTAAECRPQLMQ